MKSWFSNSDLEWEKMKSKRYCKKMFTLFGVDDIETLKKKIEKCVLDREMRYNGSFDCAPAIINYINIDEIGSFN